MRLIILSILIMFLGFARPAQADFCLPCTVCGLSTYGGVVWAPMETAKKAFKTTGEALKEAQNALETAYAEYRKLNSAIDKFRTSVFAALTGGLQKLLGLDTPPKEEAIVQDTTSSAGTSVQERIKRNLAYYDTEKKAGYEAEYAFQKRREYIRQQANIKYLARILVLKGRFKEIEKIIKDVEEKVNQSSSAATSQNNLEGSENKSKLLKTTAELKQLWIQLLAIQKQLEAARLEYKANMGLASMRPVKAIPQIIAK